MNRLLTITLFVVIVLTLGSMICREYGIKIHRTSTAKAAEACQNTKPTPSDDTLP